MTPPTRPRPLRGTVAAEPHTYGASVQGRPLEAWRPSQGPAELLIVAGIHGEEPETTVTLSAALRSVPPGDLRSAVVLAANPDGLARGTRGNARGVELNRNFPTSDWSGAAPAHHFTRAEPQDVLLSAGSGPASEPETTALMALVADVRPAAVLTFHAPLGCVLDPEQGDLAQRLARATELPLRRDVPSPTPGTLDTWVRESAGVPAVTLELPVISKDAAIVRFLEVLVALLTEPRAVGGAR
jgi:protein MpaA